MGGGGVRAVLAQLDIEEIVRVVLALQDIEKVVMVVLSLLNTEEVVNVVQALLDTRKLHKLICWAFLRLQEMFYPFLAFRRL